MTNTLHKIFLGSLTLTFCFCLMFQAKAQSLTPNYTVIGNNEGLPEAKVSGLTEDIDGFVWFANGATLTRWDGQHFQRFNLKDKKGKILRGVYNWTASWDSLHVLVQFEKKYLLFNTRNFEHWEIFDRPPRLTYPSKTTTIY
jgi:ligand-binding sensor domain-containing protein